MQALRFQAQDIYIMQKTVELCGQIIPTSKKKVVWVIKHGQEIHTVICYLSLYSGKKKVTHNGNIIMNLSDSKESLDCFVIIGSHRMIFMVDEKTEQASIERKYIAAHDQFMSFKNIYSQPVTQVYEKYFG